MTAPRDEARPTVQGLFNGWGNGSHSSSLIERVGDQHEVEEAVRRASLAGGSLLARGLGRSYGDAAQCAGGAILDCLALDDVLETDFDRGIVRVGAGLSIAALLDLVVPQGWFVPVTPGTSQVTIGGAIAADVHGKNHHRDGSFSGYVVSATLVTASGPVEISNTRNPALFWTTVGGMGLTGVLTEVTIRLTRIESSLISVDTDRTEDLDECMSLLVEGDASYRYSVAWVDCAARGRRLGRSVLTRGDHAVSADLSSQSSEDALAFRSRPQLKVPLTPPANLVSHPAIRLFNELFYRRAPSHRVDDLQPFGTFFYPLDVAREWYRLYGPRGFTQYQFVVPFDAGEAVRTAIEILQGAGAIPALAVLKRFGEADPAPLSFPMPGWTLAMDIPLSHRALGPLLDRLDDLVVESGGRVYLAKDGRLRPEMLAAMYPRIREWQEERERVDPARMFVSDLARRLDLVG